jgi:hypothetical protein
VLLFVCLILAIFCQFAVTTSATISGEIDQLLIASDRTAAKINQEIAAVNSASDESRSDKTLNTVPAKTENEIANDFTSLWFDVDRAGGKLNLLRYITSFVMSKMYETGNL